MEKVVVQYCILDACTILNLLRIDEDDILLKMLFQYNISISEKVLSEVRCNKGMKFKTNENKYFEEKISRFYPFSFSDDELKKKLGGKFNEISSFCNYLKKENGELFSTALALFQSRSNKAQYYFYTDDFPAKETFSNFFEYQQIGKIQDSVDLLLFLFWTNKKFSHNDFKRFLSSLLNEEFKELKELHGKLQTIKDNLPINLRKDKSFVKNFSSLLNALQTYKFDSINSSLDFFGKNKRKYKVINTLLLKYPNVLRLSSPSSGNLANKLINTLQLIPKYEIMKVV
jgi:hypothetical protein